MRRIAAVENCFGISGKPLAIPGRILVGESVLTKMCRKGPKVRKFYLFNDILVYGTIVIDQKKFSRQHIIPLDEVQVQGLEDNAQYKNGWLIRTTTKSFIVYAATALEKYEWLGHTNKCIEDLRWKNCKKPVENHAAVWVPDNVAPICMLCKKTQFTVFVRRHHCRKCGIVVCGPCSSTRFVLPQISLSPVRVCISCFDMLSLPKIVSVNKKPTSNQSEDEDISEDEEDEEDDREYNQGPTFYIDDLTNTN